MPCCILALLAIFGPRLILILVWIFNNPYLSRVYNTFIIPCLGFIFLPWVTLAYAFAANTFPSVTGFAGLDTPGVIVVLLGLLLDILSYSGSGWGNRHRIRGYYARYS